MLESIKQILIRRDNMSDAEAEDLIAEAREAFDQYLDDGDQDSAENVCNEFFNLELDYLDELL